MGDERDCERVLVKNTPYTMVMGQAEILDLCS